jgi:ABC-type multidrug transport system ATPase subunit
MLSATTQGKTTTFRMISGEEPMSFGTATIDGFDIRSNLRQVRCLLLFSLICHHCSRLQVQ